MTKIVVVLLIALLVGLLARRAFTRFLASPRGREIHAVWQLLKQLGAHRQGAAPYVSENRAARERVSPSGSATRAGSSRDATGTRLVRCRGCDTHVPEARARRHANGDFFCSEDCERRAAP